MEIEYRRNIPVRYETEVCVVGGGPAGVAAAVTAAGLGCPVLLLEGQGSFGGAASNAFVPAFMQFGDGVNFLAGGFARRVYEHCARDVSCVAPDYVGIDLESLRRFYDSCVEEAGVSFRFFTQLVDVQVCEGRVTHAVFSAKSGLFAVQARLFIDATGDGDLCAMAGNPWEMGDERGETMPPTLCSLWDGIDWEAPSPSQTSALEAAISAGVFRQPDRHHSGIFRTGADTGGANVGHAFHCRCLEEADLTQAMVKGRRMLPEYEDYYTQWVGKGFANARALLSAPMLGVRETRRITGRERLTLEDYLARACFENEIGRYAYPVDIHPAGGERADYEAFEQMTRRCAYKEGESYGIPYGCLVPALLDNVLMAGRCISTDRPVQASVRVMPACFLTGQAAGAAAAQCISQGCAPAGVNTAALREVLRERGTYLPPMKG